MKSAWCVNVKAISLSNITEATSKTLIYGLLWNTVPPGVCPIWWDCSRNHSMRIKYKQFCTIPSKVCEIFQDRGHHQYAYDTFEYDLLPQISIKFLGIFQDPSHDFGFNVFVFFEHLWHLSFRSQVWLGYP